MNNYTSLEWNDAQIIELTSLWAAGFTAEQIRLQMGTSRSAVCGKVRRLMLPIRAKHITERKPRNDFYVKKEPKPVVVLQNPDPVGPIGAFPEFDACRYIAGEVNQEFQCCGAPASDGSWCDFHRSVVFVPMRKHERRARL